MGNCCNCKQAPKRKIVLLLVGLDNAGKTVAVKGLAGENLENSIPTVGFSVVNLNYLGCNIQIYDLGGGSEIRGIWHRYFVDAYGVIFVVDASDFSRIGEAKIVLEELISHEKISGKPILILANKQDNSDAFDEIDLVEIFQLENLVNENKCPTLVESCSAKENRGNKIDSGIKNGYNWLINYILREYKTLNQRVELDVETQKEMEAKLFKEKVQRLRLENEIGDNSDNKSDEVIISDPFRPINELISDNLVSDGRGDEISVINAINKSPPSCIQKQNGGHDLPDRPRSAVQIVKQQLEKTNKKGSFLTFSNNKTAPVTLLSPKSAPTCKKDHEKSEKLVTDRNLKSASESREQILTVTELPNAIIDANGQNIGDLFELNHFSTKKLPPLRQNMDYDNVFVHKPLRNNVSVLQTNVDEIYKDIS